MSNRSLWGWWAFEKDFMEKEVVSHEHELGRRVLGQGTMCRGGEVVNFWCVSLFFVLFSDRCACISS